MAKINLTEEQKIARRERSRKRRAAKKGIEYVPPTETVVSRESTRKAKKEVAAANDHTKNIVLFKDIASLKDHQFHRFGDNDNHKMVYYMTKTATGSAMRGAFCKINNDGRLNEAEYNNLDTIAKETGFIGFVKEN